MRKPVDEFIQVMSSIPEGGQPPTMGGSCLVCGAPAVGFSDLCSEHLQTAIEVAEMKREARIIERRLRTEEGAS